MAGFVLGQEESFWWPVNMFTPKSGGKYERLGFEIHFKRYDQEKVDTLARKMAAGDTTAREICEDIVLDWRNPTGITYPDGTKPEFENPEHRSDVFNVAGMCKRFVDCWVESSADGNRRKNL